MPRPRRAARRTSALVLGAALLTGCAGSGGGGGDGQAQPSARPLAELVQAGAASTATTGSSKLTLTSQTRSGGQEVVVVGTGAYDHAAHKGRLVFSVPGVEGKPASAASIEERVLGEDLYLSLPQPPGVFYRLKLADVATTSLGSSSDPTSVLQALREVTDVEDAGRVELRGVEVTRYRGELDVQRALAGATGNAKRVLETTLGATDAEQVPFEAYLDDQGRVVKLVVELELQPGPATGGRNVTSRSTLELYDFGTAVDVVAPPAASVRDGAPLLAALRGAVGASPGPSASAPAPAR